MQNSGISSLANISASPLPIGPARKRFALTGRSVAIDPRRDAVRRDLADVRLADRVFAPHYAAPMPRVLTAPSTLRAARAPESEVLAPLTVGDVFEVLELAGGLAWGIAPGRGLVGYVDAAALGTNA
ncbi:SH3 domain-containing protein [Sphingomonas sp. CJ20]